MCALPHTEIQELYSKEYATAFGLQFEPKLDIEFESLSSPLFYNYSTDRLFGDIPYDHLEALFNVTTGTFLHEEARRMFTSRSGFISHYNPDPTTWGHIEEWDHNQWNCLLHAAWEQQHDESFRSSEWTHWWMDATHELVSSAIDSALDDPKYAECRRMARICSYLYERWERNFYRERMKLVAGNDS